MGCPLSFHRASFSCGHRVSHASHPSSCRMIFCLPYSKNEFFLCRALVQQYSKNIASYNRWLGFIRKAKKLSSEHKLATTPLPADAPLPQWYIPKKEVIKAPDGQQYVIYYADQTAEEHEKEESGRLQKRYEEEVAEGQKWKRAHNNGEFEFNLSGKSSELSKTIRTPVYLGRDRTATDGRLNVVYIIQKESTVVHRLLGYMSK